MLLSQLSQIKALKLVHFNKVPDKFSTHAVLTGKLTRQHDQVRVVMQIKDVISHQVIWAKFYQGKSNDLFALQDSISADLLGIFQPTESMTMIDSSITPKEFQNYLLARQLWEQRTPESLSKAKTIYQQMHDADKLFPLAAVGLCETYQYLHLYADWTHQQVVEGCQPLLQNALEQQHSLGQAKAAMGLLRSLQKRFILAEESFLAAIKETPNYAFSYLWYGNMIREQGHYKQALEMIEKAYELSPMNSQINRSLAYAYLNLRKIESAQHFYRRSLELDELFPHKAVADLDFFALNIERAQEFLAWANNNQSILTKQANYRLTEAQVRLSLGQVAQAEKLINALDQKMVNPSFLLYMQASLASVKGERGKVVDLLRQRLLLHQNNERFILPYVLALYFDQQYQTAMAVLKKHLPKLADADAEITFDNQYALTIYAQLLSKLESPDSSRQLSERLSKWFIEQPIRPNLWMANWLIYSAELPKAQTVLTSMLRDGWLPDFNSDVLPLAFMQKLFQDAGLPQKQLAEQLRINRNLVLKPLQE